MDASLQQTLRLLAHPNWRGVPSDQLLYILQDAKDSAEIAMALPDSLLKGEEHQYYLTEYGNSIEAEIQRRRQLMYTGVTNTNKETIAAIKTAIPIEDVLAWYTEVFLHKRNWTYRCTLHGADEHPSGAIYPKEQRAWCFTCNTGGDVFAVVQLFERLDFPAALKKLARHIGLNIKSVQKRMGVVID